VKEPRWTEIKLWLAFMFVGLGVAVAAWLMILAEDFLIMIKGNVFQYLTIYGTTF